MPQKWLLFDQFLKQEGISRNSLLKKMGTSPLDYWSARKSGQFGDKLAENFERTFRAPLSELPSFIEVSPIPHRYLDKTASRLHLSHGIIRCADEGNPHALGLALDACGLDRTVVTHAPNSIVSFQMQVDLLAALRKFGGWRSDDIHRIGHYSVTTLLGMSEVAPLRKCENPTEMYRKVNELVHLFDQNHEYQMVTAERDFCVFRAIPLVAIQGRPIGSRDACMARASRFQYFPRMSGFSRSESVVETKCVHRGDRYCEITIRLPKMTKRLAL